MVFKEKRKMFSTGKYSNVITLPKFWSNKYKGKEISIIILDTIAILIPNKTSIETIKEECKDIFQKIETSLTEKN